MPEKFIPNKLALITLLAASSAILVSMGLRQTFGLFFSAFEAVSYTHLTLPTILLV